MGHITTNKKSKGRGLIGDPIITRHGADFHLSTRQDYALKTATAKLGEAAQPLAMTTTNQTQLGNPQLAITDQLRGAMDAGGVQLLDQKQ